MKDVKRNMVITFVLFVVITLALFMIPGATLAKPIKIGLIDPYTGGAAAFAKPDLPAWQMVLDEFNAKGGLDGSYLPESQDYRREGA